MTDPKAVFRKLRTRTGLRFVALHAAPSAVQDAIAQATKLVRHSAVHTLATGTPQVAYQYDPVNGKLQYIFETYPDKSSTVIEYDTETKNTWSTVIFDSNPAGLLTDFTSVNRDGTLYENFYDTTVSGNPLNQVDFTNADGTWNATFYDTKNQQPWSKSIDYYTAASVLTSATVFLRSGSTEYQVYDTAHGDALQTDTTYAPGGTASEWVYDTANVNTWSKYHYGASGTAKVDQTFYYRTGATETLRWDVAHGDALQYDDTNNTNGTVHEVANDTANANNWSTLITDWYTQGGQVQDQTFFERDGVSNTNFYATNGVLAQNVTIGAAGEKAIAWYNAGGGNTTEVFDEESRLVYTAFLSASNALVVQSPAGYTYIGTTWYNTHSDSTKQFQDSSNDYEYRFTYSANQTVGLEDSYADKTSDISLFSTAPGIGLSEVTSLFDTNGHLKDIVETTTQSGSEHVVTFTAAELMQSLSTPGTLTFVEHGERLLLVNAGIKMDGFNTSSLFWQSISGTSGTMQAEATSTSTMHYVGNVIGAASGVLSGFGAGRLAVAGLTAMLAPEAVVPAVVATAIIGVNIAIHVTTGWLGGGLTADSAAKVAQDLTNQVMAKPPGYEPGGSMPAPTPDYGDPTADMPDPAGRYSLSNALASSHVSLLAHS